jgi:hypothetical protein
MRFRSLFFVCAVAFATCAFAKDAYLSIGGSVGVFRTDMRIFNPSSSKDITVQAYLLPTNASDNSGVQPVSITVPKRQMLVYNDVVSSLFHASGLGGIRLSSSDDFVATQRIYATTSAGCTGGTTGQFVPGLDVTAAKKQGVLIQLKATGVSGQIGTYRTNIGVVNPNSTAANVSWRLYDKNTNLVGNPKTATYGPFVVLGPTGLAAFADSAPASVDLSDGWLSFVSDQPLLAYASVIDDGTEDGTLIPMSEDTGTVVTAPTGPTSKTYNVLEQSFTITITPPINLLDLNVGDVVTFHITVRDSTHGFELIDPAGAVLIPPSTFSPGQVIDKTWTVSRKGTYAYFCTNSSCGSGHNAMTGEFSVQQTTAPPDPGPRY